MELSPFAKGRALTRFQTLEDQCLKTHNNKYSYEKTIYRGNKYPAVITCPIHGDFTQRINDHLTGHGCTKCGRVITETAIRSTTDNFIIRATEKYNNKFQYTKTVYVNKDVPVIITCPIHGDFKQTPDVHLMKRVKHACTKCAEEYRRWGSLPYKNTPTIFYIVELKESLFKIGITLSGSIQKRYKDDKNFRLLKPKTILEISFIDGYDAWNLEQYTLTMFKENKYASKIPILSCTGNTEILTVSPLEFVKTSILNNKFKDTT